MKNFMNKLQMNLVKFLLDILLNFFILFFYNFIYFKNEID